MPKTIRPTHDPTGDRPRAALLKQSLLERRAQLQAELTDRIRVGRTATRPEGTDSLEHSEQDVQNELALSLLRMQTEALAAIDAALARVESGGYGVCVECERDISTRRLRALPFAVRCHVCEETREDSRLEADRVAQGRGRLARPVAAPMI